MMTSYLPQILDFYWSNGKHSVLYKKKYLTCPQSFQSFLLDQNILHHRLPSGLKRRVHYFLICMSSPYAYSKDLILYLESTDMAQSVYKRQKSNHDSRLEPPNENSYPYPNCTRSNKLIKNG